MTGIKEKLLSLSAVLCCGLMLASCGSEMSGFGSEAGKSIRANNLVDNPIGTEPRQDGTTPGSDTIGDALNNLPGSSLIPGLGGGSSILSGLFGNGGASNSSKQGVLAHCLKQWGSDHPFSAADIANAKVITTSQVAMHNGQLIDYSVTSKPRLTLVTYSSVASANIKMDLQNPNGWYCIDIKSVALFKAHAKVHCKANVAEYKSSIVAGSGVTFEKSGC